MPRPHDAESIIELRQYTLRPGRRDGFVERFEREFVHTQEADGIEIVGIFCDLDDPDRFVWLRAFSSYEARAVALTAFYDGSVWAGLRDETNADLIDSDDVLMLRPVPELPSLPSPAGELSVSVWSVASDAEESALLEQIDADGGVLRSHPGANNFPRQPIRADRVVVALSADPAGLPAGEIQRLRLSPTARSPLR